MNLTNRFYNEEQLRNETIQLLDLVNKEEASQWVKHPCTRALKFAIQSDMAGIINVWLDGGYSDEESVNKTAQREAKARGMAQTLDDILETIKDIGILNIREEQEDDRT